MNIAFCINRLALIGLGVTISSLIQNCSETSRLTLWFLCADLNETDKSNLKSLLSRERFKGKYNVIDFDSISNFGNLRSLHGDWTTYGRLLLPELLLEEDIVLYLDADLVIEFDVLEMGEVSLEDFPIGAASNSKMKYSIEKDFFINRCNLSPEDSYFNAGVLLINLSLWRGRGLKDKCLEFGKQYSDELIAADQTIFLMPCLITVSRSCLNIVIVLGTLIKISLTCRKRLFYIL
jgi:lipopolysaccharide biosynthesis glycosyltransferase